MTVVEASIPESLRTEKSEQELQNVQRGLSVLIEDQMDRLINGGREHLEKDPLNWFDEQMENRGFIWVENIHEQDTLITEQDPGTEPLDQEPERA